MGHEQEAKAPMARLGSRRARSLSDGVGVVVVVGDDS